MTFAPWSRAISKVRSVLPQSTTTISSAIPCTEFRARGKLCSSLRVIRQVERRFIGLRGRWQSAVVSHKDKAGEPRARKNRFLRNEKCSLLRLEIHTDHASADSKLGAIQQHRRANALFVEERSVRRIHVFQIDVGIAYFEQAVMARNFRVLHRNVRALAPQHHSRLGERVAGAL